jgi:2-hydroxychromene-2-carboxylate isomerase
MVAASWYFDLISPFAYLQWQRLRSQTLQGSCKLELSLKPVLLGVLLNHHGQLGPAEIPSKRAFTYHFVRWQAARMGVDLRFPPAHPFNPLLALRLVLAMGCEAEVVDRVFAHIWRDGRAADSVEALLTGELGAWLSTRTQAMHELLSNASVKVALKSNTDEAIARGVFGVPTLAIGKELFFGADATDFALAYARDPSILADVESVRLNTLPVAIERRR